MKYKTKRDAAEAWVREFDAIQTNMIGDLMEYDPEDWQEITMYEDEESEEYCEGMLPMWGTMWQFHDSADIQWFEYGDMDWWEGDDALTALSKCGFRVYESEKYGYFFGIEGAGYDFYEEHWIPLYEARGLQWHEEEEV